eukprot:PhF_6_TR27918/c1_g1_i2/m.41027
MTQRTWCPAMDADTTFLGHALHANLKPREDPLSPDKSKQGVHMAIEAYNRGTSTTKYTHGFRSFAAALVRANVDLTPSTIDEALVMCSKKSGSVCVNGNISNAEDILRIANSHPAEVTVKVTSQAAALELSKLTSATAIDVSNSTALNNEAPLEAFCKLLEEYHCKVNKLEMKNTKLTNFAPWKKSLMDNRSLETLGIAQNELGRGDDSSVTALFEYVKQNKFVTKLDVSENDLNDGHFAQFFEALANSNTREATPPPEEVPEPVKEEDEPPIDLNGVFPEEDVFVPPDTVEPPEPAKEDAPEDGGNEGEDGENEEEEEPTKTDAAKAAGGDKSPRSKKDEDEEDEDEETVARKAAEKQQRAEIETEETGIRTATHKEWYKDVFLTLFEYQFNCRKDHGKSVKTFFTHLTTEEGIQYKSLKDQEIKEKTEAKERQKKREREDRERRSGWSHIIDLNVRNNQLSIKGSKMLALALRSEIPNPAVKKPEGEEGGDAEGDGADNEETHNEPPAAPEAEPEPEPAPEPTDGDAEGGDEGGDAPPAPEDDPDDDGAQPAREAPPEGEHVPVDSIPPPPPAAPPARVKPPPPPATIPGLTSLSKLDCANCSIGPKALVPIMTALKTVNSTLHELNISKNSFGYKRLPKETPPDDAADDTPSSPSIKRNLDTKFVSPGVTEMCAMLTVNRTLHTLELGSNHIGSLHCKMLFESLAENNALTSLGLECNNLAGVDPDAPNPEGWLAMAASLSNPKNNLQRLNLRGNSLATLFPLLASPPTLFESKLTYLDLSNNGLSDVPILPESLTYLNVSSNLLTAGHVQPLLKLFNLETLIFDDNDIGNDGLALLLQEVSAKRTTISAMNVRANTMDIAACLGAVNWVHLRIADNYFPDDVILTSLRGLRSGSPKLTELELWSRDAILSPAAEAYAIEFAREHKSIEVLNLSLSDEGQAVVREILMKRKWKKLESASS